MENTGHHPELVHVLRHSFRPSEKLDETLKSFVPEESRQIQPPIAIKSLSMVALNMVEYINYSYSHHIKAAEIALRMKRNHSFEIAPEIEVRRIGETALAILMGVQDNQEIFRLMRSTYQRMPTGEVQRDGGDSQFLLYARINSSVPISAEFEASIVDRFDEKYEDAGKKHLFRVLPDGLTQFDQVRLMANTRYYEDSE